MGSSKITTLAFAILVLAGGFFIAKGLGWMGARRAAQNMAHTQLQGELKIYRANLESGKASDEALSLALQRLSLRADPEVKTYILRYWKSSSLLLRAAAVESAGSFLNEGFLPIVKEGLNSDSEILRTAALRGLGRQSGPLTEHLVLAYLQRPHLGEDESVQAAVSLLKVATTPATKQLAINALAKTSDRHPEVLFQLFTLAPRQTELIGKAKAFVEEGKSPEKMANSIQYLTAWDGHWMGPRLASLPIFSDLRYQEVILDSLRSLCPQQKNEVLSKLRNTASVFPEVKKGAAQFSCR